MKLKLKNLGSLFIIIAGLLNAYIPYYTFNNSPISFDSYLFLLSLFGFLVSLLLIILGILILKDIYDNKKLSYIVIILSILSILNGTLSGMGIALLFGVCGSVMILYNYRKEKEILLNIGLVHFVSILVFVYGLTYWYPTMELLSIWLSLIITIPVYIFLYLIVRILKKMFGKK